MNNDTPHSVPRPPSRRRWLPALILGICIGASAWLYAGTRPHHNAPARSPAPPLPVVTRVARAEELAVSITGIGTVTPLTTVTVTSRVDGQLMEVLYREGQTVTRGQHLASIDPRPFQVQLTQAQGQLARDQALLDNARLDLHRYQTLWAQNAISSQQLDTQEALVRQYRAAVQSDRAQVDSARLQLGYSRITAPCDGRVGLRLVDAGNMVHAGDGTGLVVITRMQPITVVFTIPEDSLPQVMARLRGGHKLTVEALDREQLHKLASGTLLTLDNRIDPTSGTVKLKAIFPNRNNELFPNQFVNARLLVDVLRDAITVPSAAIQNGPKGPFVYLVRPDRTVELRPVARGESERGTTVVTRGLAPGDEVVVEGGERLREGSRVAVRRATETAQTTDQGTTPRQAQPGRAPAAP